MGKNNATIRNSKSYKIHEPRFLGLEAAHQFQQDSTAVSAVFSTMTAETGSEMNPLHCQGLSAQELPGKEIL